MPALLILKTAARSTPFIKSSILAGAIANNALVKKQVIVHGQSRALAVFLPLILFYYTGLGIWYILVKNYCYDEK